MKDNFVKDGVEKLKIYPRYTYIQKALITFFGYNTKYKCICLPG